MRCGVLCVLCVCAALSLSALCEGEAGGIPLRSPVVAYGPAAGKPNLAPLANFRVQQPVAITLQQPSIQNTCSDHSGYCIVENLARDICLRVNEHTDRAINGPNDRQLGNEVDGQVMPDMTATPSVNAMNGRTMSEDVRPRGGSSDSFQACRVRTYSHELFG